MKEDFFSPVYISYNPFPQGYNIIEENKKKKEKCYDYERETY